MTAICSFSYVVQDPHSGRTAFFSFGSGPHGRDDPVFLSSILCNEALESSALKSGIIGGPDSFSFVADSPSISLPASGISGIMGLSNVPLICNVSFDSADNSRTTPSSFVPIRKSSWLPADDSLLLTLLSCSNWSFSTSMTLWSSNAEASPSLCIPDALLLLENKTLSKLLSREFFSRVTVASEANIDDGSKVPSQPLPSIQAQP
mmetsp:Transcript_22472/g.46820  ORF Transcript_22472/g.46820 Transcript_22472/m.46820 type:complete len:205 (+) Transcript_22472:1795-2409(+)